MRPGLVIELLREWALRLVGSLRPSARDDAYRTELSHHLEMAEAAFRQQGYSAEEAGRLARLRYGHSDRALEELRRQQGVPWFGVFTLDVNRASGRSGIFAGRYPDGFAISPDQRK